MRKFLVSAAIIALFSIPSAWAQPDHDRGHGGGPGSQEHGGPHGGPQGGGPQGGGPQGGGPAPEGHGGPHGGPPGGGHFEHGGGPPAERGPNPAYSRGPNGGGESGRPNMATNPNYSRGPVGSSFNRYAPAPNTAYSRPGGGDSFRPQGGPAMASRPGGGFNHGYGGGPRHDFRGFGDYHQNFVAPRHFHAGIYRPPAGWYPHHWVFGEFLPATFWARDYWLINFMDFGLPPPPYGAVWVRVGYDALLIDQETGEIITVEYGVFY